MTQVPPFQRKETVDKPSIVGARWWHESLAQPIARRQALSGCLILGGVLAATALAGTCVTVCVATSGDSDDVTYQPKTSLEMQQEYGWSFGATTENLVFNGESTQPFNREKLATLSVDTRPSDSDHYPFFVSTLFDSITATPRSVPAGETGTTITPLKTALRPIFTPGMDEAFKRGKALASLFAAAPNKGKGNAVIVDLPGPEAVAFAAGAASVLDPVFLFDNWPHPRAVVPAHLTLAAAVYYQPLLEKARDTRGSDGAPMFVLDRNRLATYTDEATQFDNRHVAKVPSASALAGLGVKNVIYITNGEASELDDLNDDFASYPLNGITTKLVPATHFRAGPPPPDAGPGAESVHWYGGTPASHPTFWAVPVYNPAARRTAFSSGTATRSPSAVTRPKPANFGTVPVAIAVGTGVILGAKLSRSGSWNRASGSSGS